MNQNLRFHLWHDLWDQLEEFGNFAIHWENYDLVYFKLWEPLDLNLDEVSSPIGDGIKSRTTGRP